MSHVYSCLSGQYMEKHYSHDRHHPSSLNVWYHRHRNGPLNLIYVMDILSLDVFHNGKQNVPIRLMPFISPVTQQNDCKCLEKPISTGKEWFGI